MKPAFRQSDLLLGEKESPLSTSFITRMKQKRKLAESKTTLGCGNGFPYEWAEYKTSLLVVLLYENDVSNFALKLFMHKMIINMVSSVGRDLHTELDVFIKQVATSKQKSTSRSYPVGQTQVWVKNNNKAGLWDDVYGLIDFAKWLWYIISEEWDKPKKEIPNISGLNYFIMIEIFQQHMLEVQHVIKGERHNRTDNSDDDASKTPYVGISPMETKLLVKKVKSLPNAVIEPWLHPGTEQCYVPYFGGYGRMIKKYRDDKNPAINMYSSLQCGMSGSVNYFLYFYLLSNSNIDEKMSIQSISMLILVMLLQLAGDGGHNIREIIFGLTSNAIVLNCVLTDLREELQSHYGNQLSLKDNIKLYIDDPDYTWITKQDCVLRSIASQFLTKGINNRLDNSTNLSNIKDTVDELKRGLFNNMLNLLANWEHPVLDLYNITSHINIVGFDKTFLEMNNVETTKEHFSVCKKDTYDVFFGKKEVIEEATGVVTSVDLANNVQVFFALENNRYRNNINDSFKEAPDKLVTKIVDIIAPGINKKVDKAIYKRLNKCVPSIKNKPYIPYA